jgi:lipid-A-disaccharide synthase
MISCGEASGDLYAAELVSAMRGLEPDVRVSGFGGERLRAAGADLVGDYRRLSVTGLVEAVRVLPQSWRTLRRLRAQARAERPDVFVAIDFPDFNFRLLPAMRSLGVPVVYYVSPQLWAWRPKRLETLRRYVDRVLVIFPETRERFRARLGLDEGARVVALLPGSRPNEVTQLLPGLTEAARRISSQVPGTAFVVARAPALDDAVFRPVAALAGRGVSVSTVAGATDDVLAAADVAVTASGTATVQAMLHGRPMVIVYRVAPLTYALGRRLVQVSTYGMVNLIAGRSVVPELIQANFTVEGVVREVVSLLTDRERADAMRADLETVRVRLGEPGASARAASAVLAAARSATEGPSPRVD